MAEQLSAFQNAQTRTDEQKRALLASIAEQGSAGQAAFDRAQSELGASREKAVGEAASRAGLINAPAEYMAQARTTAGSGYDMRQADVSQQRASFTADTARQNAGNEEYFSKLSSSIPITESRTRAAVEQIIREQEEAKLQRQQEKEMQEASLADRDEQRTFEREDRDFQREMRGVALAQARASGGGSGGGGGGGNSGGLSFNESLKLEDRQKAEMMKRSQSFVTANLQKSASPATRDTFYKLVGSAKGLPQALGFIAEASSSGALTGVSVPALQDWLRRYYEPSDQEMGMALGLVPIPRKVAAGPRLLGAQPVRKVT